MNRFIPMLVSAALSCTPGALDAQPATTGQPAAKVVSYSDRDIVAVKAKVRFTTLIVLPKNEQILDFTCGDKEFWIVNGNQNFAYVKPAKAGSRTTLNLITASGNVYSFVLSEVSETNDPEPDLKVFIELKDESMLSAAKGQPRFVTVQQVEDYRQQVEIAKAETREAKRAAQTSIDQETGRFRSEYPTSLKFPYRFEAMKHPFNVTAIYTDGKFTYIQARPDEPPALYEIKDGKPDLIQFEYRNGAYIAAKVLDSGYLAIGKQKLSFIRTDSSAN